MDPFENGLTRVICVQIPPKYLRSYYSQPELTAERLLRVGCVDPGSKGDAEVDGLDPTALGWVALASVEPLFGVSCGSLSSAAIDFGVDGEEPKIVSNSVAT